ncbi:MAG TPA: CSLREA domain-containing protein, partial [Solirubrobacteraceae bacterium]|nr:CSLREA domain-containing protein [Solirubrobacteraceae bacterium]
MKLRATLPLAVALCLVPAAGASAGTITVNTTGDTLVNNDGTCSLREAVTAANTNAASGGPSGECAAGSGADVIVVPAGTYALSRPGPGENANVNGDLDIASDVTIDGAGSAATTLNGNQLDRIFHIASGTVTIEGVTITGGRAPDGPNTGGVIGINGANAVAGAGAPGAQGGGVLNIGTLTIENSTVTGNRAGDGGNGGGASGGDAT